MRVKPDLYRVFLFIKVIKFYIARKEIRQFSILFIQKESFIRKPLPMIVKEIVCELLIATHLILFLQSKKKI